MTDGSQVFPALSSHKYKGNDYQLNKTNTSQPTGLEGSHQSANLLYLIG